MKTSPAVVSFYMELQKIASLQKEAIFDNVGRTGPLPPPSPRVAPPAPMPGPGRPMFAGVGGPATSIGRDNLFGPMMDRARAILGTQPQGQPGMFANVGRSPGPALGQGAVAQTIREAPGAAVDAATGAAKGVGRAALKGGALMAGLGLGAVALRQLLRRGGKQVVDQGIPGAMGAAARQVPAGMDTMMQYAPHALGAGALGAGGLLAYNMSQPKYAEALYDELEKISSSYQHIAPALMRLLASQTGKASPKASQLLLQGAQKTEAFNKAVPRVAQRGYSALKQKIPATSPAQRFLRNAEGVVDRSPAAQAIVQSFPQHPISSVFSGLVPGVPLGVAHAGATKAIVPRLQAMTPAGFLPRPQIVMPAPPQSMQMNLLKTSAVLPAAAVAGFWYELEKIAAGTVPSNFLRLVASRMPRQSGQLLSKANALEDAAAAAAGRANAAAQGHGALLQRLQGTTVGQKLVGPGSKGEQAVNWTMSRPAVRNMLTDQVRHPAAAATSAVIPGPAGWYYGTANRFLAPKIEKAIPQGMRAQPRIQMPPPPTVSRELLAANAATQLIPFVGSGAWVADKVAPMAKSLIKKSSQLDEAVVAGFWYELGKMAEVDKDRLFKLLPAAGATAGGLYALSKGKGLKANALSRNTVLAAGTGATTGWLPQIMYEGSTALKAKRARRKAAQHS